MKKGITRLYIVSDFHASDPAWRKMLNVVKMGIYKADAVLYAGDLTGKAILPVVQTGKGYETDLLGQHRVATDEKGLMDLDRDIAAVGFYPFHTSQAELDGIGNDEAAIERLFLQRIRSTLEGWMDLATERLAGKNVPVFLVPGNDDPYEIDDVLDRSPYVHNADGKVLDMPGDLQVIGMSIANQTPWDTPRELPEEQLRERIDALASQVRDPKRTVFLLHCPPYDSGLDTAPVLDETLRPVVSAGDLLRGPVGSKAVRGAIEHYGPLLGVHGHVHESAGDVKIKGTVCINPGSEASHGILRGYLVDVSAKGVERVFRVEG